MSIDKEFVVRIEKCYACKKCNFMLTHACNKDAKHKKYCADAVPIVEKHDRIAHFLLFRISKNPNTIAHNQRNSQFKFFFSIINSINS